MAPPSSDWPKRVPISRVTANQVTMWVALNQLASSLMCLDGVLSSIERLARPFFGIVRLVKAEVIDANAHTSPQQEWTQLAVPYTVSAAEPNLRKECHAKEVPS